MPPTFLLEFEKPILELEKKIAEMRELPNAKEIEQQIVELERSAERIRVDTYSNLTRWQRVQIARHPDRPYTLDYLGSAFDEFVELHGDRCFRDDPAIVAGIGRIGPHRAVVMGHQKGRDTKSNIYRNFGMPNPDGYRKALRLMQMAERFRLPVVSFLDTPGAYPGLEAEERGQAQAIAQNLMAMARLRVPIVVIVIGEGASGGALGIGIGDRVMMLENSWYSVISPESCSSILWRSWDFKEQAAEALQLSAKDLLAHKIIDEIIPEPIGGAHRIPKEMMQIVRDRVVSTLDHLITVPIDALLREREQKFAAMGHWVEL